MDILLIQQEIINLIQTIPGLSIETDSSSINDYRLDMIEKQFIERNYDIQNPVEQELFLQEKQTESLQASVNLNIGIMSSLVSGIGTEIDDLQDLIDSLNAELDLMQIQIDYIKNLIDLMLNPPTTFLDLIDTPSYYTAHDPYDPYDIYSPYGTPDPYDAYGNYITQADYFLAVNDTETGLIFKSVNDIYISCLENEFGLNRMCADSQSEVDLLINTTTDLQWTDSFDFVQYLDRSEGDVWCQTTSHSSLKFYYWEQEDTVIAYSDTSKIIWKLNKYSLKFEFYFEIPLYDVDGDPIGKYYYHPHQITGTKKIFFYNNTWFMQPIFADESGVSQSNRVYYMINPPNSTEWKAIISSGTGSTDHKTSMFMLKDKIYCTLVRYMIEITSLNADSYTSRTIPALPLQAFYSENIIFTVNDKIYRMIQSNFINGRCVLYLQEWDFMVSWKTLFVSNNSNYLTGDKFYVRPIHNGETIFGIWKTSTWIPEQVEWNERLVTDINNNKWVFLGLTDRIYNSTLPLSTTTTKYDYTKKWFVLINANTMQIRFIYKWRATGLGYEFKNNDFNYTSIFKINDKYIYTLWHKDYVGYICRTPIEQNFEKFIIPDIPGNLTNHTQWNDVLPYFEWEIVDSVTTNIGTYRFQKSSDFIQYKGNFFLGYDKDNNSSSTNDGWSIPERRRDPEIRKMELLDKYNDYSKVSVFNVFEKLWLHKGDFHITGDLNIQNNIEGVLLESDVHTHPNMNQIKTFYAGETLLAGTIVILNNNLYDIDPYSYTPTLMTASNDIINHSTRVLGMVLFNVNKYEEAQVLVAGEIESDDLADPYSYTDPYVYENPEWNWVENKPLYLARDGELTQFEPEPMLEFYDPYNPENPYYPYDLNDPYNVRTPMFSIIVGYAITSTKIIIRIEPPILFGDLD